VRFWAICYRKQGECVACLSGELTSILNHCGIARSRPKEPSVFSQVLQRQQDPNLSAKQMTAFIETALHSGVDLANARASKILLTRTERHAELPLSDFVHVYQAAWQFILWSEAIVGRVVGSLRGVAASQVRTRRVSPSPVQRIR
jgi:hypothetical protein